MKEPYVIITANHEPILKVEKKREKEEEREREKRKRVRKYICLKFVMLIMREIGLEKETSSRYQQQ